MRTFPRKFNPLPLRVACARTEKKQRVLAREAGIDEKRFSDIMHGCAGVAAPTPKEQASIVRVLNRHLSQDEPVTASELFAISEEAIAS